MRFITLKTLTWPMILLVAVLVIFLLNSYLSHPSVQDSSIPPLLEPGNEQTQAQYIRCDPLVIAMDSDGNVYSGRDFIGRLTNPSELTTRLKEVVEARIYRLAYTRALDLNLEVPPPRCSDGSVFIKTAGEANDGGALLLTGVLQDVGIHPTGIIKDKKKF